MNTSKAVVVLSALVLAACMPKATYRLENQTFESKDAYLQAFDAKMLEGVAAVTPLPAPLTTKKLVFAIPGYSTVLAENIRRFQLANGRAPTEAELDARYRINADTAARSLRMWHDAIKKRNIYASVSYVELDSMSSHVSPSPDTDVLYNIEPQPGSNQWFFASMKNGRQIFAFDRTQPGTGGRVNAMLEALAARAISE